MAHDDTTEKDARATIEGQYRRRERAQLENGSYANHDFRYFEICLAKALKQQTQLSLSMSLFSCGVGCGTSKETS